MDFPRPISGIVLAALTLTAGIAAAPSAKAEDLVDFLWGGSAEYGGGRSVVSFDPQYKPGQIIVSFSDRRLYLITKPGEAITYPVAVPMGEARWQGVTFVSDKKVNPPWTPTPDMVRQNPRLPRWVPGGHPMNPLGIRAMYLGSSAYRIHGTDAPWTIGQAVSHGCIRMTNEDVLDLYPRVPVGTRVTVTWQRFSTRAIASNDYPPYSSTAAGSPSSNGGGYTASASATQAGPTTTPPARNRPQDGSLSSLFFWDNEPSSTARTAPAAVGNSASAETSPKKKSATTSTANSSAKKKSATAEPPADPAASPPSLVQDPVKPTASETAPSKASSSGKSAEVTPLATKASASAEEGLPVQKASAEVQ